MIKQFTDFSQNMWNLFSSCTDIWGRMSLREWDFYINLSTSKIKDRCCLLKWEFSKRAHLPPTNQRNQNQQKTTHTCDYRTSPGVGRINIHVWDYLAATNRDPFDFWIFTHILDKIKDEKQIQHSRTSSGFVILSGGLWTLTNIWMDYADFIHI